LVGRPVRFGRAHFNGSTKNLSRKRMAFGTVLDRLFILAEKNSGKPPTHQVAGHVSGYSCYQDLKRESVWLR